MKTLLTEKVISYFTRFFYSEFLCDPDPRDPPTNGNLREHLRDPYDAFTGHMIRTLGCVDTGSKF